MKYVAVAATLAGAAVADYSWAPLSSTTPVDPTTTSTWSEIYDPSTWSAVYTTTTPVDPVTWGTYVKPTTTTSQCSYVTEVPVKKCHKGEHGKADKCWDDKTKTTYYADECTWSNYPVEPVTKTETVYVSYVNTWADYSSVEPTTTDTWAGYSSAAATETVTWSNVPVAASTAPQCSVSVVTSYGAPIWKPTPEAPTTWATVSVASTSTWATYSAPSSTPVKGNGGYAPMAPNGNKWSMTYTPYDSKGQCKTEEVIKVDIAKLAAKGFVSVRVYSTKCQTLEYIGNACRANNVKMILGVFIDKYGVNGDYVKQQVTDIVAWKQWDIVELIVIGNEAIYQNFCKPEDLVWLIQDCKTKFAAAGYKGSCTTTEPLSSWQTSGAQFCKVVDVVAANLYAYFNADTTCDHAGEFIAAEIEILEKICVGKEVYVMESGWPSAGNCNGKACPGKDQQKTAIKSIQETCGAKVVFFSFEDELWKEAGQFGVEQHWGCADVFDNVSTWQPVTVTSTTKATSTWAGWTTTTTPVDPTSTWAAY